MEVEGNLQYEDPTLLAKAKTAKEYAGMSNIE